MKEFFLKMLNSQDPTNSKIFVGLLSFVLITAMVVVSFFKPVQIEVLYAIVAFCGAMFGLSTIPFKQ